MSYSNPPQLDSHIHRFGGIPSVNNPSIIMDLHPSHHHPYLSYSQPTTAGPNPLQNPPPPQLSQQAPPHHMDGFLNWDFDLEPPIPTETWSFKREQECPTCRRMIDVSATSLHAHVSGCFLKTNLRELQGERDSCDGRPDADIMRNMQNVQRFISKMDLRTRLGMMESFYRLSKSQDTGELAMSPRNPAVNLKTQAHDNCVLNLLYGNSDGQVIEEPLSSVFNNNIQAKPEPFREVMSEFDILHDHTGEEHEMLLPFDGQVQGLSFNGNPAINNNHNPSNSNVYGNHGHLQHHF